MPERNKASTSVRWSASDKVDQCFPEGAERSYYECWRIKWNCKLIVCNGELASQKM